MDPEVLVRRRRVPALADRTRLAILQLILDSEDERVLVGETAAALRLRQPTVSHHMRKLLDEGVVTREPQGRRTWYAIAPASRERVRALLAPTLTHKMTGDLSRVVADLHVRFAGEVPAEVIERQVHSAHAELLATTSSDLLTSRTAAFAIEKIEANLPAVASSAAIPNVLFVCVHNAGRSQIAASVLRRLAGPRARVHTAGSAPAQNVRSSIVTVLDEVGLSLDGEYPKPLNAGILHAANIVVSMGCGDLHGRPSRATHFTWHIPDPAELPLEELRRVRDTIDRHVRSLLPHLPS